MVIATGTALLSAQRRGGHQPCPSCTRPVPACSSSTWERWRTWAATARSQRWGWAGRRAGLKSGRSLVCTAGQDWWRQRGSLHFQFCPTPAAALPAAQISVPVFGKIKLSGGIAYLVWKSECGRTRSWQEVSREAAAGSALHASQPRIPSTTPSTPSTTPRRVHHQAGVLPQPRAHPVRLGQGAGARGGALRVAGGAMGG